MFKIGVLLLHSSIAEVNLALASIDLFLAENKNVKVYVFVHRNATKSNLVNSIPKRCNLLSHSELKSLKSRLNKIINGSAIISHTEKKEIFKATTLYDKLVESIYDDPVEKPRNFGIKDRVYWSSVFNPCDGYGSSAEQMIKHIYEHTPMDVLFKPHKISNLNIADPIVKSIYDKSKEIKIRKRSLADGHFVYYAQPHEGEIPHLFKGKMVNFTMWESDKIPPRWVQATKKFTEIWVPSQWGKDCMESSGIKNIINVVPLGVNTELFQYRDPEIMQERKPFKFFLYANAHWLNERKNYQLVFDAFQKAFRNHKDVKLVLKLSVETKEIPKESNIEIVVGRLDIQQIYQLLRKMHCFVFVSSGEGFGLPPREAMSSGVPVILSNSSALQDVAIPELSFPVQPSGKKAPLGYPLIYGHSSQLGYFDTFTVEDIAEQMRFVYENYNEAIRRARNANDFIRENQTYKHTARRIYSLLTK